MSRPLRVKVVTAGSSGVGKTSIILRIDGQEFSPKVVSTLGASYVSSRSKQNDRDLTLLVWDTAGQERFRSTVPMYARGARAVILVYDVSSRESFHDAPTWLREVKKTAHDLELIVLMANKVDLKDARAVTEEEGQRMAFELGGEYFETSAKDGTGITAAIARISELIAKKVPDPVGLQALPPVKADDVSSGAPRSSRCCAIL